MKPLNASPGERREVGGFGHNPRHLSLASKGRSHSTWAHTTLEKAFPPGPGLKDCSFDEDGE